MSVPGTPLVRFFQVSPRDLVYLKFILEAHEGVTTMSTVDKSGIIRISYCEGDAAVVEEMMTALGAEIAITEVTPTESGFAPLATACGREGDRDAGHS